MQKLYHYYSETRENVIFIDDMYWTTAKVFLPNIRKELQERRKDSKQSRLEQRRREENNAIIRSHRLKD